MILKGGIYFQRVGMANNMCGKNSDRLSSHFDNRRRRIGAGDLLEQLADMDDFVLPFDGTYTGKLTTQFHNVSFVEMPDLKRAWCKTAGFNGRIC
jgi:hypothetical protein